MSLTNDELDGPEIAAYLCDGQSVDYFVENVLPKLSSTAEGELWVLAGRFLNRGMVNTARFIAAYAAQVAAERGAAEVNREPGVRPDAGQLWAEWRARALRDEIFAALDEHSGIVPGDATPPDLAEYLTQYGSDFLNGNPNPAHGVPTETLVSYCADWVADRRNPDDREIPF
jgi:hypothetical protein